MKNLYKAALLAALGLISVTAAQAQSASGTINNNDLVLGFTSTVNGVSQDYILDLGQIPTAPNTQLGGISLSAFNSIFGANLANGQVNAGIVGGLPSGTQDVITSTLQGAGAPSVSPSKGNISGAAGTVSGLQLGAVSQSSSASFFQNIAETPSTAGAAANSFAGYLASNPLSTIGTSETLTLDLYKDTFSGKTGTTGWSFIGDIALDLSGPTLSAVFDPTSTAAVPEPATYGMLAGAGLLAVSLRRQVSRKTA